MLCKSVMEKGWFEQIVCDNPGCWVLKSFLELCWTHYHLLQNRITFFLKNAENKFWVKKVTSWCTQPHCSAPAVVPAAFHGPHTDQTPWRWHLRRWHLCLPRVQSWLCTQKNLMLAKFCPFSGPFDPLFTSCPTFWCDMDQMWLFVQFPGKIQRWWRTRLWRVPGLLSSG